MTKAGVEKALKALDKAKQAVYELTLKNPKKNRDNVLRYLGYAETNIKLATRHVEEATQAKEGKRA